MKTDAIFQRHTENCPYFTGRTACLEYAYLVADGPALEELLENGFRHFGTFFFRPVCIQCHECVPLRLPLGSFSLTCSARRVRNKNRDLTVRMGRYEDINKAYRLYTLHKRKFGFIETEALDRFVEAFFEPLPYAREIAFFLGGELVALAHIDLTESAVSAVYTYYDHITCRRRGLGHLAIVTAALIGKEYGAQYFYLGYAVRDSVHMSYKLRFYPSEILVSPGDWKPFRNETGEIVLLDEYGFEFYPY